MNDSVIINKTRVIRFVAWPNILCMMAFIAIGCTPYLMYNVSNLLKLIIAIFWVLSTFLLHPFTGKEKGFAIVIGFSVYLGLQLFYSLLGISREFVFFLAKLHIYVIPMAMVYMTRYYNTCEIKLLWYFFLLVFGANLAGNIFIGLTQGEYAFRNTDDIVNTNAGGTSFVVACMLTIPILWILIRSCKRKELKFFSILLIGGMSFYILVLNTRATAMVVLLVFLLGFLIVELNRNRRLPKRKLVLRMILIAGVVALLMGPIITLLSNAFSENIRMLSRIEDLSFVMDHGNVEQLEEGSLYARSILWMASINTFFSSLPHFLFGVGDSVIDTDLFSLLANGVGNHSEFFDLAARYGVIGIIIYIIIIKNTCLFVNSLTDDIRIRDYLFVFMLGVMIFGFANNLSNNLTTMLSIYFMLPMTIILIDRKAL